MYTPAPEPVEPAGITHYEFAHGPEKEQKFAR
jgi:hypothetical protein